MKTTFKYFTPETLEDLKKLYKSLAMKHHPDVIGGNAEVMKIINSEYDQLFPLLKDFRKTAKGEKYTANTPNNETPEQFKDIISKIIHLEGILIEIIGCFIWITGNTRQYKEIFKALNFRWNNAKVAWYLSPDGYKKRHSKTYSLDEIRDIFGNEEIESKVAKKIKAG